MDEAEDATAALHRMLAGNDPMQALKRDAAAAEKSMEMEEAEDATESLHRMLSGNDPMQVGMNP